MTSLTRTRLGSWSLVASAPVLLAADLVRADHSGKAATQFAQVSAHRGPELLSAALFLVGAILLVLAVTGLAGLVTGRGGRLAGIGVALLGIGALWMAAGRSMFAFLVYAASAPGPDHATAGHVFVSVTDSSGFAIFLPLLLAVVAAPLALGLGLWRAGLGPLWPALLWIVAAVAYLGVEGSKPAELATFGPMMVALAAIGAAAGSSARRAHAERLAAAPA